MSKGTGTCSERPAMVVSAEAQNDNLHVRKPSRAKSDLLKVFSSAGYASFSSYSDLEKKLIDPNLDYFNSQVDGSTSDPPRPYTSLFRYAPQMGGKRRGINITTEIKLDHYTGDIFVIGDADRPQGISGRSGIYHIINCKKDLKLAINTAQELYNESFTELDRHTKNLKYTSHPDQKYMKGTYQQIEYEPDVFNERRDFITQRAADAVREAQYQKQRRINIIEQERANLATAQTSGYTL
jgi:hypothetical protein